MQKLIETCERWIETAQDEIDNINGWRNADPSDRHHLYWAKFPQGETMPNGFTSDTLALTREIPKHCPGVGFASLQEVLGAITAWHETRSADGLPAPASLTSHLSMSLVAVVGLRGLGGGDTGQATADKATAAVDMKAKTLTIDGKITPVTSLASLDFARRLIEAKGSIVHLHQGARPGRLLRNLPQSFKDRCKLRRGAGGGYYLPQ